MPKVPLNQLTYQLISKSYSVCMYVFSFGGELLEYNSSTRRSSIGDAACSATLTRWRVRRLVGRAQSQQRSTS